MSFDRDKLIAEFIEKGRKATAFLMADPDYPIHCVEDAADLFISQTSMPLHIEDAMMFVMHFTCELVVNDAFFNNGVTIDATVLAMIQAALVGKILEKIHS